MIEVLRALMEKVDIGLPFVGNLTSGIVEMNRIKGRGDESMPKMV